MIKESNEVLRCTPNGRAVGTNFQGDNPFQGLARKHWLNFSDKATRVQVKPDVLKNEIWNILEKEDFEFRLILSLESLLALERLDLICMLAAC